jgi:trans-aconitate methyltransferase
MTPGTTSSEREWDGAAYHRVSEPQFRWGLRVLEGLALRGDERALDAGAGTGRLTAELLARLPRGAVVAQDVSRNMLAQARAHLARFGARVSFREQDLLDLEDEAAFDLVFSTATFHWVLDHERLFARLFRALRPGGRLVAQCGGAGNLQALRARADAILREPAYRAGVEGWSAPWTYPDAEVTAARLAAAGFEHVRTGLEAAPTRFAGRAEYLEFVERVVLRLHVARIAGPAQRTAFLERIADSAEDDDPPYTLDYVRLNLSARRP